jgi:hypothetical protein
MKRTWIVCACLFLLPSVVLAQTAKPAAIPRTADGHPDLNGVWWRGADLNLRPLADAPTPAAGARGAAPAAGARGAAPQRPASFTDLYTPEALAKRKTLSDKDDPTLRCIPTAFGTLNVSLFGEGFLGQIVQTPKFVVMLKETFHGFKIVPIDGRPHRDDVPPGLRGDSIGRWEGDTLVVETVNFTDTNWIFAEGNVSFHSDAMRVVERYRMTDADTLEIDAVVEDPKVLKEPWRVPKQTLRRAPFDQIMEVGCTGTETYSLMEGASKENYGRK